MSIWTSVYPPNNGKDCVWGHCAENIPERDQFIGAEIPDGIRTMVDVATATSWHDLIRLSITLWLTNSDWEGADVLMDVKEAETVIVLLTEAIEKINKAKEQS